MKDAYHQKRNLQHFLQIQDQVLQDVQQNQLVVLLRQSVKQHK